MTLNRKVLLTIASASALLVAGLYTANSVIVRRSFDDLEHEQAELNLARAQAVLADRMQGLLGTAGDWALWDDAYHFMEDESPAFVSANLSDSTFRDLDVNLIMFVQSDGRVALCRWYDLKQRRAVSDVAGTETLVAARHLLDGLGDPASGLAGLLVLPSGLMMVAIRPILTTDHAGPARGALVMGRFVDAAELQHLKNLTRVSVGLIASGVTMPPDCAGALAQLMSGEATVARALSDDTMAGYAGLEDLFGHPIGVLRVAAPRWIREEGDRQFLALTVAGLLTVCLFGLMVSVAVRRQILYRLAAMDRSVRQIESVRDLSARVEVRGRDELAQLATHMNRMLEALQGSEREMAAVRSQLEEKVHARTAELVRANETLQAALREQRQSDEQRRKLQEEVEQMRRIESIGRLAGSIAHDFNNLLTPILGYADLSLAGLSEGSALREPLKEIRHAADRARQLTQQILAFSRKQVLEMRVVDLNAELGSLLPVLRRLIGEDVRIETCLAADIMSVMADPGKMQQVVLNLVVNARDAMPGGGRIVIETANGSAPDPAPGEQEMRGPAVMLSVTDTGQGMPGETMSHLFEPFFTTKEPGRGTGLGLATVYGIVKQHGGQIRVSSEVGRGSCFRVYMPAVSDRAQVAPAAAVELPAAAGGETLLVAEDDATVRHFVCEILRSAGYTVIEADCGETAVSLAGECPGTIHLLVSDVIMRELNGPALYEQLRRTRSALKVIYMSGYPDDVVGRHGILDPGIHFLAKPFVAKDLLLKVRGALDG